VTDPDVTRFFMTVEEAVELVIQAGAIGRDGEVLILDMGQPVRIADVAQRLAARADRPPELVYTGLRPGEKLHEDLLCAHEIDVRPFHPLITHADVAPVDQQLVLCLDSRPSRAAVELRELAATVHGVEDLPRQRSAGADEEIRLPRSDNAVGRSLS